MKKNCKNCYWLIEEKDLDRCIYNNQLLDKGACENHKYKCMYCENQAEYKIKDAYMCFDCLADEFELETYQVTHYEFNGENIGSDEDISEVINNIHKDIEELE